MKQDEERCCGNCCWFCFEDTDGWGFCNTPEMVPEHTDRSFTNCEMPVRENATCGYVSRQEMRHHMAVMLKYLRDKKAGCFDGEAKWPDQLDEPIEFAYKYMKTFGEL